MKKLEDRVVASQPGDRAERVAETALGLFLERGYDGTPMSLVAKNTGLTKAGIYHYFESKEQHLLYVVHKNHVERQLLPLIEKAAAVADPELRLRRFISDYALLLARDPSVEGPIDHRPVSYYTVRVKQECLTIPKRLNGG